ncbi:nucleotidyltransferase domain-containing protein [Amycolatopsis rhabdoformis]|uniref:Nucleotidyltransferase domain-containing protein n=1 Tax=Amycolatopsis rhabdoformis TaxID=1448059 RepID=A0ABZ1IFY6_9PSEU|nr:nucleotidyltransferase domain-containing protein [Amycolatopsis rhabdoformis]WSE33350.1 nucleotidyltransferase domain-containing protein [Amycolatopsis rhabdoformis]
MPDNSGKIFADQVADELAALPGVEAVALGGSRARDRADEHRADSGSADSGGADSGSADSGAAGPVRDWDLGLYYRGAFDPGDLRALGHPGEVSELGEWGGGVFNGGAWLTIEGRRVDVHYRDLATVEHELAEARAGRFHWEPLAFHLAGIPSYLVVAELAINEVLRGSLPRPDYPPALQASAPKFWHAAAEQTLTYAKTAHVARGNATEAAASLGVAALQTAHAVLAARGEWVTNEKTLVERAGLRGLDDVLDGFAHDLDGAFATGAALLRKAC